MNLGTETMPNATQLRQFSFTAVLLVITTVFSPAGAVAQADPAADKRPNIIWIVVEDASPHIGCYGETTIKTPTLDLLAERGFRFSNAFVTCPVCSPSRSAMVTGMYQTTLGAHNHRSQGDSGKAKGGPGFLSSYRLPVPTIPELFQKAGYYTSNSKNGLPNSKPGKTDYNFVWDKSIYDAADWAGRKPGQPFFTQVQLRGGKNRNAKQYGTDPADVNLPPYYPDDPVLRRDWADYLNSWVQTDRDIAAILARLDEEGIADPAVFIWTDHGVSHLRGKQFLYDEGVHVPLIVKLPDSREGIVRDDLVTQLDVAATSLALAGIEVPAYVQGVDLFADDYVPRDRVFSARDRCDETVDFIRCVRTKKYKYIRNFLSHLPHAQPNQYKDGKKISQAMRQLHSDGRLTEIQARPFRSQRPTEELYDLENDPQELVNLASNPTHSETTQQLRKSLYDWMQTSGDLGVIPEPVLEQLGKEAGNKHAVLNSNTNKALVSEILAVIEASDRHDIPSLTAALDHGHPAIRYWAATGIGLHGTPADTTKLGPLLDDPFGGVRVAAALAQGRLNPSMASVASSSVESLTREIDSPNYIVGMYAMRALEFLAAKNVPVDAVVIRDAQKNPHEFTRRIAKRLTRTLADPPSAKN